MKRPKNILLVYSKTSVKGYNHNGFMLVWKQYVKDLKAGIKVFDIRRPGNVIMIFADGSYLALSYKEFISLWKDYVVACDKKWSMRL